MKTIRHCNPLFSPRVGRRSLVALALLGSFVVQPDQVSAQRQVIERGTVQAQGPITVQLQAIEMGQLVTMLLRDVMRVPYAISPDVVKDRRPTSVSLAIPRNDIPRTVVRFLRAVGYKVELIGGAVHVSKGDFSASPSTVQSAAQQFSHANTTPSQMMPSGSPLSPFLGNNVARSPQYSESPAAPPRLAQGDAVAVLPPPAPAPEFAVLVEPAYRSPGELASVIETMFPDLRLAYRDGVQAKGGTTISSTLEPDRLGITGPEPMVRRALAVMTELDRPRPLVRLSGAIIEVRNTETRSSALAILADLLGGVVGLGSLSGEPAGDTFLSLELAGVKAVLSAVRGDSRFRVVAEPTLSAVSGSTASFNSGSQVPILGAVAFGEEGQTIRSVEYRDSGLTLRVSPTVRLGLVELAVVQERSNFVRTTTGVDESPTLNRNSAEALVTVAPGGVVALAGLKESSNGDTRRGLFGGLLGSKTREKTDAELLVLIQADVDQVSEPRQLLVYEFPAVDALQDKPDAL